jgi:hypothetical protein
MCDTLSLHDALPIYVASETVKAAQLRDTALAAGEMPQSLINQAYTDRVAKINEVGVLTAQRDAGLAAQRESKKSGGQREGKLESFLKSIQTERETLESWRSEQMDLLKQFNESELAIVGGQAEAKLRVEQEYQSRLQAMRNMQLSDSANFFGALANVAAAGGQKMVKAVQVFSATQALINSYVAYTEVLKDPSFIGRPFARFAAAAGVLAAGLNMVQAIKGGGSSGRGAPSGAAAAAPASAEVAAPQRVIIEGIDRNSLISGEQLSGIFEALYKENENRGFVFEVAR